MARQLVRRRYAFPPPVFLAVLYLALVLAGTALLLLPVSTTHPIAVMEAFFTATSAVTVTGLSLFDIGTTFTLFGQVVILVLIQLGGLGLMTFAVIILSTLGVPIDLPFRNVLQADLNEGSHRNLGNLVKVIARIALTCELVGAVALAFVFLPEFGIAKGTWHAVFHAVSAFNNAGFSLSPDSLSAWVANPVINLVIPALFLIGGLGFVVIGDILRKPSWRKLSLHSKLMLVGSLCLTLWGFASFAALEWTNPNTLGGLGTAGDRLWASWFQAVTPRTAGFNTLDLSHLHDSTSLVMIALMLVGGGSASTAGGIKVTTLVVLVLATLAFFRRHPAPRAYGRRIGQDEVMKVMALTTVSMIIVLGALFIVSISHDGDFLDLAFEIASAFGTAGLTRGATTELDTLGRIVVMALMFIGRVGPLTLGVLLATRGTSHVRYPEGQVYLG